MDIGKVFSFITNAVKKVYSFFTANPEISQFLIDYESVAMKIIENISGMDLDGDGKRKHAREEILKELKDVSYEVFPSMINLLIEICYTKRALAEKK